MVTTCARPSGPFRGPGEPPGTVFRREQRCGISGSVRVVASTAGSLREVSGVPEVPSTPDQATRRPWRVLAIMCIGFFLSLLDGSIINVAVPTLIHGLNASYDQVLWVIDGYLLVFSVLLISTGRLGDIFGYRRLYVIGIVTFTVASALCGLAGSPAWLLA